MIYNEQRGDVLPQDPDEARFLFQVIRHFEFALNRPQNSAAIEDDLWVVKHPGAHCWLGITSLGTRELSSRVQYSAVRVGLCYPRRSLLRVWDIYSHWPWRTTKAPIVVQELSRALAAPPLREPSMVEVNQISQALSQLAASESDDNANYFSAFMQIFGRRE